MCQAAHEGHTQAPHSAAIPLSDHSNENQIICLTQGELGDINSHSGQLGTRSVLSSEPN